MFLFWIVPYSLIGGKWLRYTLSLMPFVYMLAAVGVDCSDTSYVSRVCLMETSVDVSLAIAVIVVRWPTGTDRGDDGPHYALYTNALAADKAGYFFPHDEFYDDGLREAINSSVILLHREQSLRMRLRRRPILFGEVWAGRSEFTAISATDFNPSTASRHGLRYCATRSNIFRESR